MPNFFAEAARSVQGPDGLRRNLSSGVVHPLPQRLQPEFAWFFSVICILLLRTKPHFRDSAVFSCFLGPFCERRGAATEDIVHQPVASSPTRPRNYVSKSY